MQNVKLCLGDVTEVKIKLTRLGANPIGSLWAESGPLTFIGNKNLWTNCFLPLSARSSFRSVVPIFVVAQVILSLAEMEKKLADWRHSSDTILDADGAKRMQASEMKLILCSFQSNKTTVAVFGGYNPHPISC